jgi:ferrous iron transport protein B
VFVVCWTTGLAYMAATVFYQGMTYQQHPVYSLFWITGLLAVFSSVLCGLWLYGRHSLVKPISGAV